MAIWIRLTALVLAGSTSGMVGTTQSATSGSSAKNMSPPLVFEGVTVVDVEHGTLMSNQRVVIVGNRIQAMGDVGAVKMPAVAHIVKAAGKYLIPGLWDMHVHSTKKSNSIFLAYGVTGIRDAWSKVHLDTLMQWRREIVAGRRVGPPRQLLSGAAIDTSESCVREPSVWAGHVCVSSVDSADARRLVGALRDAGADMIKIYGVSREMYWTLAREARQAGLPFGGHRPVDIGILEASDSGATLLDHVHLDAESLRRLCPADLSDIERCGTAVAQRLRDHGTWLVSTAVIAAWAQDHYKGFTWTRPTPALSERIYQDLKSRTRAFQAGTPAPTGLLGGPRLGGPVDSLDFLALVHHFGLPIVAGTDVAGADMVPVTDAAADSEMPFLPGLSLHAELAIYAAEGLSALEALQSATLNPAKMLRATDSLGTVAPGKLADLVLLDADPLADVRNAMAIHAVVANGRYFDRAALDALLAEARNVRQVP